VDVPFLTGLLQLLVHFNGTCLRSAAQGKLHSHDGQTQQHQAQHVDQNKAAAAVLTGHPGELPYIAAANGAAGAQKNESQTGSQTFSIIHFFLSLKIKGSSIISAAGIFVKEKMLLLGK